MTNDSLNKNPKPVIILGYCFFIFYIIFSLVFYRERMIPFDGAFYSFKMVEMGNFNIELHRYGAVLTQLLPFIAIKCHASLETILSLYSVNFILVQFALFLVIVYGFRNHYAALALLLVLCVGYRYQYFYTVSEIHQTLAPLVLLFALMQSGYAGASKKKNVLFLISVSFIYLWIGSMHLLGVAGIFFVVGYCVLQNNSLLKNIIVWISLVPGTVFVLFKMLSIEKGSYDESKMINAEKLKSAITNLQNIPSFQFFKDNYQVYFKPLILLAVILLCFYVIRRRWKTLIYFSAALTGLFLLIIAYNQTPDSPIIYQNYYPFFAVLVCIPFCEEIFRRFSPLPVLIISIALISYSSVKILSCADFFTQRIEYLSRMKKQIAHFPERKFIVDEKNINWNLIMMDWNLSFESLMNSSIASPDSAFTFVTLPDFSRFQKLMNDTNLLIGVDFSPLWFTSQNLNQDYFRLRNTLYKQLNTDQSCTDKIDTAGITIRFPQLRAGISRSILATIPVVIKNHTSDTLHSRPSGNCEIVLSCRVYNQEGKLTTEIYPVSRLETDVYPFSEMVTAISIPAYALSSGKYTIEADLFSPPNHRWNRDAKCELVVNY